MTVGPAGATLTTRDALRAPVVPRSPDPFALLLDGLRSGAIRTKADLHRAKVDLCRRGIFRHPPRDSAVLGSLPPADRERFGPLLREKPSRTASGVAVVAAMMAPAPCPHGVCIFCPGGPRQGTPQSYLGTEPAAMRGARFAYDPFGQVRARVERLRGNGHPTDKIDLIVLGGTFTSYPESYRASFVRGCFDGLNGFASDTLEGAQRANETAACRCVGLTVETKPERFGPREVGHTLGLGTTRVEFGVQSTFDDVLRRVNRGHTVEDVREATRRAKDAGLKVGYHVMPGLPGSTPRRDLEAFRTIFADPSFRPDLLKVYPTVVVPGTGLHELWRRGEYDPLTTEQVVELLAAVKPLLPPWVRLQRVQREFGVADTAAGLTRGNVRELARARLEAEGKRCGCIRCREVGLRSRSFRPGDVALRRTVYRASNADEVFLSYELPDDSLVGYARVRLGATGAYLREVKVLGQAAPLHTTTHDWQHRGFGRRLLEEALAVARGAGHRVLRVTSGVGVREYYRQHARRRGSAAAMDGPYVALHT